MGQHETTKEAEAAVADGMRQAERDLMNPPPPAPTPLATGVETMRQATSRRARPA